MSRQNDNTGVLDTALKNPIKCLLAGVRFLTILPTFTSGENDEYYLPGALYYFCIIGLFVGSATAAVFSLLVFVTSTLVSLVLAVILLSLFSGFLHLDGLADTADGFMSSRSSERCLEIMRDSCTGVMGCAAVCGVWFLKIAALLSIPETEIGIAFIVAATAGRVAIVCLMSLLPYARAEGGLASLFSPPLPKSIPLVSLLLLTALTIFAAGGHVLATGVSFIFVLAVFTIICRRRIGGFTGDTLGAVCELTETAVLLSFTI